MSSKMSSNKLMASLLIGVCAISTAMTDLYLPSILNITTYFGLSEKIIQLSLTGYLWASVTGMAFSWKLENNKGRCFTLFLGIFIFLIGTGSCWVSTHFESLFIGRCLQGFGAALLGIIGWAVINDLYNLEDNAKSMSWLGCGISIIPLVAPIVGGTITQYYGWQVNFLILLVLLIIITFLLLILLKNNLSSSIDFKQQSMAMPIISMRMMLKDPIFRANALVFPMLAGNEWCWLTIIPFYFKQSLQLSSQMFGCYLALIATGATIGTFFAPKIIEIKDSDFMINLGIKIHVLGILLQIVTHFINPNSAVCISLSFFTCLIGTSLVFGPSSSQTLGIFPDLKKTASFLRNALIIVGTAIGGTIGNLLPTKSLLFLCLIMLAISISAWILFSKIMQKTVQNVIP